MMFQKLNKSAIW